MTALEQEITNLNELLEMHRRRQHQLELARARMGNSTPPDIVIDIQDGEHQIKAHENKLAQLEAQRTAAISPNGATQVKVVFKNRETELEIICDIFGKQFVFINAPPGFGKTFLLKRIETVLQTSEQKWLSVRHACRAGDTEFGILQNLIEASGSSEISPLKDIVDFLGRLIRVMNFHGARALLVQLDAVEQWRADPSWSSVALFVLGPFAEAVSDTMRRARLPFKMLLAGRYIVDLSNQMKMPTHERSLSPFDFDVIREYVYDSVTQSANSLRGADDTEIDEIAERILEITGGHPNAVRLLINEYQFNGFAISPRMFFDPKRTRQLFNVFVTNQMEDLLRGVPEHLRHVLRVLCVFRRFNGDTLNALMAEGYLERADYPDGWDLYKEVLKTGVVGSEVFFARDHILRSLLDTELCFSDAARANELHEFAAVLYNKWLDGKHHDGTDLAIGVPTGEFQIELMLERLYHVCNSLKQPVDKTIVLGEIESYPPRLHTLGRVREGRLALRRAIERDKTLFRLLKRILGETNLLAVLDGIEPLVPPPLPA